MAPHQIFLIPPLTSQLDVHTVCCLSIAQIIRFALGVDRKATLITSPNTYAHFALSSVYPDLSLSPYEPNGWEARSREARHGNAHFSTSETHRHRLAWSLPPSHHRFGDVIVDMGRLSHGSDVAGFAGGSVRSFSPTCGSMPDTDDLKEELTLVHSLEGFDPWFLASLTRAELPSAGLWLEVALHCLEDGKQQEGARDKLFPRTYPQRSTSS